MSQLGNPMRWPSSWTTAAALARLNGTGIDCLVIENTPALEPVTHAARGAGITVVDPAGPPEGVRIVTGEWPGIAASREGNGHTSAGPTGEPWVDSNGWKIRLERALHAEADIWVAATPPRRILSAGAYRLAIADAATYGGRWMVTLDDELTAGIAAENAQAIERWKALTAATSFFAGRTRGRDYAPRAVIGILSTFAGANEFLSHELLNLLARTNQQYRILVKGASAELDCRGLRALLYVDNDPLPPELRSQLLSFAAAGGLLIVGPKWHGSSGAPVRDVEHPRYDVHAAGKGRIAIAKAEPEDPYRLANDSVVLVSHRYELLRFWNCGAVGSYLTASPDGKSAVAQLIFYADRGPADATVRITGRHRSANLSTLDRAAPRPLELHPAGDGLEVHLPQVDQYAAIELEV